MTKVNKFPEPLFTNLQRVCCNLYLAPSGIREILACIPSFTITSKLQPKISLFHIFS